MQLMFNH